MLSDISFAVLGFGKGGVDMTLRMRFLWARDLRARLGKERYRTFIRVNGGKTVSVCLRDGSYNKDYCADPFPFFHNGIVWLFYETLNAAGKGVLGCLKHNFSTGEWDDLGIILERPWHLSYPQVFEDDGRIFMIPESCDSTRGYKEGRVTLYEANIFPYDWQEVATLIDEPMADATLFKLKGHYYLSCLRMLPTLVSELWSSPSLKGPWTKHPQSSNINQSKRLRRNGGAFQCVEGVLCRIAQDCNGDYGKRLFKVPVLKMSPTEYEEGKASLLLDDGWPKNGMKHTYNRLDTPGGLIEVIDVKDYVPYPVLYRALIWIRIICHFIFRLKIKGKRGFLVQIFGFQVVKGCVKERPAFVQIRLGSRKRL